VVFGERSARGDGLHLRAWEAEVVMNHAASRRGQLQLAAVALGGAPRAAGRAGADSLHRGGPDRLAGLLDAFRERQSRARVLNHGSQVGRQYVVVGTAEGRTGRLLLYWSVNME
jgi:hypothetical protein